MSDYLTDSLHYPIRISAQKVTQMRLTSIVTAYFIAILAICVTFLGVISRIVTHIVTKLVQAKSHTKHKSRYNTVETFYLRKWSLYR